MNANKPDAKCPEEKKVENMEVEQPSGEVQLPPTKIAEHGETSKKTKEESDVEYYGSNSDDPSDYDHDKSTYGYSDDSSSSDSDDDDSTEKVNDVKKNVQVESKEVEQLNDVKKNEQVENNEMGDPSEEVKLPRAMLEYHADLRMKMLERQNPTTMSKERLKELEEEYDAHAHEYYSDDSYNSDDSRSNSDED